MSEPSDTMLILAALKYAVSKGDGHRDVMMDRIASVIDDADWTGKRFVLTAQKRQEIQEHVPAAYWLGAINDNL